MPDSGAFESMASAPGTAEIRQALETLRHLMNPGLYEQLDAQLSARERDWPRGMPKPPPYPADDEALEEPRDV